MMDEKNIKKLLKKANKYIKDPDNIIDPYDMTFVWVNDRVTKSVGKNLVGERVASTSEDPKGKEDFGISSVEATQIDYKVKKKEILIKTGPKKNKKALINFVVIEFDDQPYMATKIIKFKK